MKPTQESAQQYLPLIMGIAEGKTLQVRNGDRWADAGRDTHLNLTLPPQNYRIKPGPPLVISLIQVKRRRDADWRCWMRTTEGTKRFTEADITRAKEMTAQNTLYDDSEWRIVNFVEEQD